MGGPGPYNVFIVGRARLVNTSGAAFALPRPLSAVLAYRGGPMLGFRPQAGGRVLRRRVFLMYKTGELRSPVYIRN
jgi:hypothetical protein